MSELGFPEYTTKQIGGVISLLVLLVVTMVGTFAVIEEQREVAEAQEFVITYQSTNSTFTDNVDNWENVEENVSNEYHTTAGGYRKQITIDNSNVVFSSSENYVLLVQLDSDTNLATNTITDNGNDIVFRNSDGELLLNFDIESYDNDNGALTAWVQIPTLSGTSDYILFMDYGDSSLIGLEDEEGTWGSGYSAVWHLSENELGTDNDVIDSSGNNNHLTSQNLENTDQVAGKIDGSLDFDGVDEYLNGSAFTDNFTEGFTIIFWMDADQVTGDIFEFDGAHTSWDIDFSGNEFRFLIHTTGGDPSVATSGASSAAGFFHVVATYDGADMAIYMDGALEDSTPTTDPITQPELQVVNDFANLADGRIDGVRLLNRAMDNNEIATIFNNEDTPSSFYSLSAETILSPISHIATEITDNNNVLENGYWYNTVYIDINDEVISATLAFSTRIFENTGAEEINRYVYLDDGTDNNLIWSSMATEINSFTTHSEDVSSFIDAIGYYTIYLRTELKSDNVGLNELHVDWDDVQLTVVTNDRGFSSRALDDVERGVGLVSRIFTILFIAVIAIFMLAVVVKIVKGNRGVNI